MSRFTRLISLLFLFSCKCSGQVVLAQWNFNNASMLPNSGNGSISTVGGVTASFVSGTGSSDTSVTNNALQTTGYPAVGSGNKTSGLKIHINTLNCRDIRLRFDNRNSATAANTLVIQYSTDDISYTDIPGPIQTSGTAFMNNRLLNLDTISLINNRADLFIRIVTAFSGSQYQPSAPGNYNPSGTIRYDMIAITGTPISCSGIATQQASNPTMYQTTDTSISLSFQRGDGLGCIIVVRLESGTDVYPANGFDYLPNLHFGAGDQTGAGNYVVFATAGTGIQQCTISGLTAGVAYHFSIFEFSREGWCYLAPPVSYTATCNSTILMPGDLLLVGLDAHSGPGGMDIYYLVNATEIRPGTSFSLVNSRFETTAAASVRTHKWFGPGNAAYTDPGILTLRYKSPAALPLGSIISFEFNSDVHDIRVNNAPATALFETPTDNQVLSGGFLSSSSADQLYLVSGYFTAFGNEGTDRYNLLTGNTICGISNGIPWVPFSASPSLSVRESRVPPQILCINLAIAIQNNGFAYYKPTSVHSGTKKELIEKFTNASNWQFGAGTDNVNDAAIISGMNFNVNASNADGYWTGLINSDWFDCGNWQGCSVPGMSTNTTITATANQPKINSTAGTAAAAHENKACVNSLKIQNQASLSLSGSASDCLTAFGIVEISNTGAINFEDVPAAIADTMFLKRSFYNNGLSGYGMHAGKGTLVLENYSGENTVVQSQAGYPTILNNLVINCGLNVMLAQNSNLGIDGSLRLQNGIITTGANSITLNANATVSSPINVYGETDNGWGSSFINGRLTRVADNTNIKKFPIGSASGSKLLYAPCAIQPASSTLKNILQPIFHSHQPIR